MKFRPLRDRVLIRGIDPEVEAAGGIIIFDTAKESQRKARWSRSGGPDDVAHLGGSFASLQLARFLQPVSSRCGSSSGAPCGSSTSERRSNAPPSPDVRARCATSLACSSETPRLLRV